MTKKKLLFTVNEKIFHLPYVDAKLITHKHLHDTVKCRKIQDEEVRFYKTVIILPDR